MESIIFIIVLIISVVIHELAHGYTADALGDPTPELAGRLTMNPIKHLDFFGSIFLPALLILTGAPFVLGWAKPVPFNPHYFKNKKWGGAIVAVAGPLSNIAIALIFALVLKFIPLSVFMIVFVQGIVVVNVVLALFNLVPIPPLDGHHIIFPLIPEKYADIKDFLRKYSFVILIFFIMYGWRFFSPFVMKVVNIFLSL